MIIFLTLVLIMLMVLIGGERGAMSIMTLAGNIVILFFSIMLMSAGFPVLLLILVAGAGVCYISLFYQNGNNPKTRAAFLAGNVTFVCSDLYYHMEIRKLRIK